MFVTHQVGLTLRLSILAVTVFFMSLVTSSAASALSCSAKTSMLCTFSATTTTPTSCPSGQKVDPRTKQCVDPNNLDYNNTAQPTVSPTAIGTNQSAVCEAIGSGADCADTNKNGGTKIDSLIKTVVNILTAVVGVLAVIMIIVSGAKYITSAGDSGKITSAKNTLVYALIGLIIVALAQIVVKFVLQKTV